MKRILGLAALLGHALSAATGIQQAYSVQRWGGKRNRPYFPASRPNVARWWHDLEQPGQCARLQAAKDKRENRAQKLKDHTLGAWNNAAHTTRLPVPGGATQKAFIASLNPFYQRPVTE